MGVLDRQFHIGEETEYGTIVVPTRSYAASVFRHKRAPGFIESNGARAGLQAQRSDKRRVINMGAAASIEVDVENKGLGLLLRQMLGSSIIAQQGATTAWLQTHATTADGPTGRSFTGQVGMPPVTGAVLPFTYPGGKVSTWEISQAVTVGPEGNLKLKLEVDYCDEDTDTLLAVPAYPANTDNYGWPDWDVTIAGTAFDAREGSVKGDNNLHLDRRYGRRNTRKKAPERKGTPKYDGLVVGDFENLTQYDRFVNGQIVPIVFTWTGDNITTGHDFEFKVTMAACQYNGETPDAEGDDLPKHALPFEILHDGTNPAVKIEYKSTDNAF